MGKRIIHSAGAPKAIGPYSQAVSWDGWVFLAGQIPLDPDRMEIVNGDVGEQTHRVMENLAAVLEAAGCSFKDVVKTTVYLQDLNDFQAMNEVYARFFAEQPPARACVQVAKLPKGAKVEIDAIAKAP